MTKKIVESKCDICGEVLGPHGKKLPWMGKRWLICPWCLRKGARTGEILGATIRLERIPELIGMRCSENGCNETEPAYMAIIAIKRSEYSVVICKYHMKHMALNGATWQGKETETLLS